MSGLIYRRWTTHVDGFRDSVRNNLAGAAGLKIIEGGLNGQDGIGFLSFDLFSTAGLCFVNCHLKEEKSPSP